MRATRRRRLTVAEIKRELAEVARIGKVFVDGDLCRQALQPYAQTFLTGDDLDLNPEACVPLKKTLLRLERLSRVPCATALWRRRPDVPSSAEALLFGAAGSPLGSDKPANRGYQPPPMTPQLAAAFLKGKDAWRVVRGKAIGAGLAARGIGVPARSLPGNALVQLFAPIQDSMADVAAVLEVFTVAVGAR